MDAKTKLDVWNIDYIKGEEMNNLKLYKELFSTRSYWEEIPDEDLWEDGEINNQKELMNKIEHNLLITGKWKLIRRKQ